MTLVMRQCKQGILLPSILALLLLLTACNFSAPPGPVTLTAPVEDVLPNTPTSLPTEVPAVPPQTTLLPDAVGTLAVPTPLQLPAEGAATALPTVSAVQRIREENVLRVGVLYNTPPLSSLSERGEVVGYEAGLAHGIAEAWGVELAFVQVTRQTALDTLLSGDVDLLIASVTHRREDEAFLAFSPTYFPGGQMLMVREDDPIQNAGQLGDLRVGVVQGTDGERALGRALSNETLRVTPMLYLTLEQALGALGSGEVTAVLHDRVALLQAMQRVSNVRILETPLEPEPYAIAMRRGDIALRYLVDRALQGLSAGGELDALRQEWFPGVQLEVEIPAWAGLDEDPRDLASLDPTMTYNENSLVERIALGEGIRVAGLNLDPDADPFRLRLEGFYRALVDAMAARWGVPVEYIPQSVATAQELVATGGADLAVGVDPSWLAPYEITFTQPIIRHGDRLMVPANSGIGGFADLRGGRWVGIFANEPGKADVVNDLAEEANARVNIFTIVNDEDAVYSMLVDSNIDVAFGDSLRLIPLVEQNEGMVELTERWYSRAYISMAVPRLDPDFEALVDITLQELDADGTFARLWAETLNTGDPLTISQWPGSHSAFMGVNVGPVN